ncbi:hypothetical protein Tco_0634601 [Tanacetum coccineum]
MKADPQLQQQDIAIWLALQMKFKTLQVPQTTCRTFSVRLRDQDDPHDDSHPKGENSTKRQKTSEYQAHVTGESFRQVNEKEQGQSSSRNQKQIDDYDFWTESYASDDDEILTKQVSQDIMEEVSLTINEAELKKIADEMLRQRCTSGDEHQYHIDQMKNFLKSDIVWESKKENLASPHPRKTTPLVQSCQRDPKAPALSLLNQNLLYLKKGSSRPEKITSRWVNKYVNKFNPYARYGVEHWKNPHAKIFYIKMQKEPGKPKEVVYSNSKIIQPDYKNLNKNDTEDMYLLIMNGKVPDYAETGLLWSLSLFIKSSVIWERVHDFQLGIESYQQKVNLTAPTISFPGIEKHKMFFIIYEPVHGIIYKNSKKEKRVMRHSEIHKFCDATLNRVLEGLKSYNNDVKYGYIQRDLIEDEVEYLKLFAEEIEVRLKYHNQMRRWEMYVNGRHHEGNAQNNRPLGGDYKQYLTRWHCKSKSLLERKPTNPQDSERDTHLADMGLPSTSLKDNTPTVFETLEADSKLKTRLQTIVNTNIRTFDNLTNLNELLRNGNVTGVMTRLDALQNSFNTLNAQQATLSDSCQSLAWNLGLRMTKIKETQGIIQTEIIFCPSESASAPTTAPTKVHTAVGGVLVNESSLTPKVIDPALEVTPPKPTVLETQVGSSSFTKPKINNGKGRAKKTDDSPPKLVKALRILHPDPDAPLLIDYKIDGQIVKLAGDQLGEILDKKEKMEKDALNDELSKNDVIKVVPDVVNETGVIISGIKDFLKHQDAHLKVHNDKLRKKAELKKKIYGDYVWIVNNRMKPRKITNIHIHPRSKPISVTIYRNNDKRDFEVHKVFRFGDFSLSEWDKLGVILSTMANQCVPDMLNSISKKYEILKEITKTLNIDEKLPLPEQDPSLPSN